MRLTYHGGVRIESRTRMVAKDILALISHGAFVSLGSNAEGYEFLLFYSPFDRESKIAIVAQERSVLISVWHHDFRLPEGVKAPKKEDRKKAYELYRSYCFKERVVAPIPCLGRVQIEVTLDGKTIHTRDTEIFVPNRGIGEEAWRLIHAEVRKLSEVVEAHDHLIDTKPVRYLVSRIDTLAKKNGHIKAFSRKEASEL